MPFCPSCQAEFRDGTTHCAECGVPLEATLASRASDAEMEDLFVCYDGQQAERLAALLSADGIPALVRDRSSSAFPTTVGTTAKQVIAVPRHLLARGRAAIETAIADGVIPGEGELLG